MFDLVEHPLDGAALRRDLLDDAAGGLVIFEGLVRDHNEGRAVAALEYEIYAAMAAQEAAKIFAEARAQFDVIQLRGAHRFGFLKVGELAVWVGASARHRAEAFQACRYLIDEIKSRLPIWKKEHYLEGAAEWVDCQGCLHHHAPGFTTEQYYDRQLRLPDFGTAEQAMLREARVLVVGAGGLGCPALSALAGAGVGQITICDGDRLDVSNLHRQSLYSHGDLGQYKAVLASHRLQALNPLIEVTPRTDRVDALNVAGLVAQNDIVLDGTDNFATRFLLHDACFFSGKVLVQASVYQYEGQLQAFDFRGNTNAGCLRCAWPEIPAPDSVGSCAQTGVLGAVPAVLGSMQAMEAIKLIVGRDSPATTATVLVDLLTLMTNVIDRPRGKDCPLCGERPRIRQIVANEYEERLPWEVDLTEFIDRCPRGTIIDIRGTRECSPSIAAADSWSHRPDLNRDSFLAQNFSGDTLLVCQVGVKTRRLVRELRESGHDRVWSLWGGVEGL